MLSYKIEKTNEHITPLSGLSSLAHLMEQIALARKIDNQFTEPMSNRGFLASEFVMSQACHYRR